MHPGSISGYFDILSHCQKAYARKLEPVCRKWGLTKSELDVLLFLFNNPQYHRAADIVAHRGIAKSHVSMSVANLEQRGLLERGSSDADRRTVCLELTEQGRLAAAEGRVLQQAFFATLYSGVSEEEFLLWEAVTDKVRENITQLDK